MIRRTLSFLLILCALLGVTSLASAQNPKKGAKPAAAAKEAHADEAATAAAPPAEKTDAKEKHAQETAEEAEDAAHHHAPRKMAMALIVEKLTKFEMGPGTYNAEIMLLIGCETEPCKPDPQIDNGRIQGKPDKVLDTPQLKVFKIKADYDAIVDMSEFPFDKHTLPLVISDKDENVHYEYDANALKEIEEKALDVDALKLPGWVIDPNLRHEVLKQKLPGGGETTQLAFFIDITRPRIASFFKTLVPVFFMIFVAGFTLLLKPKSAGGRLTAATGGLMTVVMFHLSATSSLPPLGYLTRMDKFMLATYVVYLLNILFAVAIVRFDEKKNEKMAELAYLAAGGAVPGLALVAWLTVFLKVV